MLMEEVREGGVMTWSGPPDSTEEAGQRAKQSSEEGKSFEDARRLYYGRKERLHTDRRKKPI